MPVPRYRYLPVKGQFRLVADTATDLSPISGTFLAPPLRAVTTVADADLATGVALHLAAVADRAFAAVVTEKEPAPLPAHLHAPDDLPEPVARAIAAESRTVAAELAAEVDQPGTAVWLARCAIGCDAPLTVHARDQRRPGELLLHCGSCPCRMDLSHREPKNAATGWAAWARGDGAVDLTWLEAVDVCTGSDCRCHGLGTVLPGTNPLVALLTEAGRRWADADESWRRAMVVESDVMSAAVLTFDEVRGLEPPGIFDTNWTPVLLLTDLNTQVQLAIGCHPDIPGRWFAAARHAELDKVTDLMGTDAYLARTATIVADDAGWNENDPWLLDVPPTADPDDPATWPAASRLVDVAFAQHRAFWQDEPA